MKVGSMFVFFSNGRDLHLMVINRRTDVIIVHGSF